MGRSRLMVLTLAVVAALAAVFLARNLGTQGPVDPKVVEVNKVPMADVLTASVDIPLGDKVDASKLTWTEWPRDSVRPWMITKEAKPEARTELENARSRAQMFEGEPVSTQKLVLPNTSGFMAAVLPKGMRAISVAISAETGAGGFILPNDRVDVLLTTKQDAGGVSRSISETILTKRMHQLVTHGPYRWIRHPLYAFSLLELFSLALLADSWFLFAFPCIVLVVFRWFVIPREEANLIKTFGKDYEEYMRRTGALVPRLWL